MEDGLEAAVQLPPKRGRHIKKRALKNKALSVSFNEKDLKDYVTGFHKRKKKRRKEAQKQQEEAKRRKRLEGRKKRRLEREMALYGGATPASGSELDNRNEEKDEDDEEEEANATISGTTTYDNGDVRVTVTTSEISRDEEIGHDEERQLAATEILAREKKHSLLGSIRKKPFKKVVKHKSRPSAGGKREKRNKKKH